MINLYRKIFFGLAFLLRKVTQYVLIRIEFMFIMLVSPLATPFWSLTRVPLPVANSVASYRCLKYLKQACASLQEDK